MRVVELTLVGKQEKKTPPSYSHVGNKLNTRTDHKLILLSGNHLKDRVDNNRTRWGGSVVGGGGVAFGGYFVAH